MNLFKRLSLSLIAFLLCATANAQDMKISGTVYDSTGTQPLHQAMVMAVRVKDSVLLGFTGTEKNGKFVLTGFPIDTFSIVISHPRFDDKFIYIFGSKEIMQPGFYYGTILLVLTVMAHPFLKKSNKLA